MPQQRAPYCGFQLEELTDSVFSKFSKFDKGDGSCNLLLKQGEGHPPTPPPPPQFVSLESRSLQRCILLLKSSGTYCEMTQNTLSTRTICETSMPQLSSCLTLLCLREASLLQDIHFCVRAWVKLKPLVTAQSLTDISKGHSLGQ